MSEVKPFCNSCGLCCAKMGLWVEDAKTTVAAGSKDPLVIAIAKFPHAYSETGRCSQLGEKNQCNIYETRPLVCSIQRLYDRFFKKQMSRRNFYAISEAECHRLIKEEGPNLALPQNPA